MAKDRTDAIIGDYQQHPIALALMPGGMDEQEFTAFCEDVEQRGIIMPVTLYEGMILDGWHRYRASKKTGSPFKIIEYTGKDPAGYIASVNVLRRKLSSLQRALVGARLHLDHGLTQREVCKKLGISNEVVTLVLKTISSKNTPLIKRIENDADFTRGMLKEELADAGLLRAGPAPSPSLGKTPPSPFPTVATNGIPEPDDDGTEGEDDITEALAGKGLKAEQRASKKPKATAAQLLSDEFKALMADEKVSFLQMIWPEASAIALEAGLALAAPKRSASKKTAAAAH